MEVAQPNNSLELNPELIEKFKNQVAVLPTPVKVGDEMTVIDFKGETLNNYNWFVPWERKK